MYIAVVVAGVVRREKCWVDYLIDKKYDRPAQSRTKACLSVPLAIILVLVHVDELLCPLIHHDAITTMWILPLLVR